MRIFALRFAIGLFVGLISAGIIIACGMGLLTIF